MVKLHTTSISITCVWRVVAGGLCGGGWGGIWIGKFTTVISERINLFFWFGLDNYRSRPSKIGEDRKVGEDRKRKDHTNLTQP
jgi:hypothetical protein